MDFPPAAPGHAAQARPGPGRLVVVGTPIGNLDDLSPRAAETLATADLVAAEDTRRTRILLDHIGASTPTTSYHEHNERARTGRLLDRVAAGETVAVVTDAGTPGVADPGFRLVHEALRRGLAVASVPGPNAAVQALVLSGLPLDRFVFEGFLPRRGGPRRRRLSELADEPRTMVFYVPPHRAADDLAAMVDSFGDRPAALARELTKLHEEVLRAPLGVLAAQVRDEGIRGEVTMVVAGAPPRELPSDHDLTAMVEQMVHSGSSRRDAVTAVAASTGVPRRTVYQAVIDHGRGRSDEATS